MTAFLPTTTVDILRGETTYDYGDPIETATPVASNVPMSIIEIRQRVYVPAESRTSIVRMYAGRARPNVDVREGDRLRDTRSASIYLVEAVSAPASPIGLADKRLDLRRIES